MVQGVNSKVMSTDLVEKAGLSTERFPRTEQEAEIAQEVLAKELENLSLDEHEKALFDMHGINSLDNTKEPLKEDTAMVEKALEELNQELANIKINEKEAYDLAKFLNPSYVDSRALRLMFLRGERFNPVTAARTMVYHFKLKRELFGDTEVLARDIYQSDLGPEELEYARAGALQVLPSTDMAGRLVQVISLDEVRPDVNTAVVLRAMWYQTMAPLRDEETQKRGVVTCFFQFKPYEFEFPQLLEYNKLEVAIPQKYNGTHFCYTDPSMHHYAAGFQLLISKEERYRFKIHFGTPEEINFSLLTMGIPVDDCPMQVDNTWKTDWHLLWMETLRQLEDDFQQQFAVANSLTLSPNVDSSVTPTDTTQEQRKTRVEGIIIPKSQDVLFGKSAKASSHPGNIRAHQLVEEQFEEYEKAFKVEKTQIADRIVQAILRQGGRFLKKSDIGVGTWEVVSDRVAREKVSHWCRHLRQKTGKSKGEESNLKRVTPPPTDKQVQVVSDSVDKMTSADSTVRKDPSENSLPYKKFVR